MNPCRNALEPVKGIDTVSRDYTLKYGMSRNALEPVKGIDTT